MVVVVVTYRHAASHRVHSKLNIDTMLAQDLLWLYDHMYDTVVNEAVHCQYCWW
jgi:hypothetical protein